jgi:hypothetical protein
LPAHSHVRLAVIRLAGQVKQGSQPVSDS